MSQQVVLQNPQQTLGYNDLQQQLQEPEEIALQRLNSEEERSQRRRARQLFNQVRYNFKFLFCDGIAQSDHIRRKRCVCMADCLFTQNYEMSNGRRLLSHSTYTHSRREDDARTLRWNESSLRSAELIAFCDFIFCFVSLALLIECVLLLYHVPTTARHWP